MTGYLRYALKRLATLVPVALVVLVASFALIRAVPGGPFDLPRTLDPTVRANLERHYGLDEPLPRQFLTYVLALLRGDLGSSLIEQDRSVAELIAAGAPLSLAIGALALAVAVVGGVALGLHGALASERPAARIGRLVTAVGLSTPVFVLAPVLVLVFALKLGWLPVGGVASISALSLVLPVAALAWMPLFEIARLTRTGTEAVLERPYVRAARARGLSSETITRRYVLAPALRPALSYLGPLAAQVLAGSLVVERVFGLPGMGGYLVEGALSRDYPLVLGATLVYLVLLILMNLIFDLALASTDPRLRREGGGP